MLDAVHQAANLFEQVLMAGVFIVVAVIVVVTLGYELQTKKKAL